MRYRLLIKLLNPLVGIRAKHLNINTVFFTIEEIYSVKFLKDSNRLLGRKNSGDNNDLNKESFPHFVINYISDRYQKKVLSDQNAIDLINSLDFYKGINNYINLFSRYII